MKEKKYKKAGGFTTADIIVAIIIIVMFVSIITTAFYNYYTSVQGKTRQTMATNIVIDVIENVEMMEYDNINIESVNNLINELKNNGDIPKGYEVEMALDKYNETEGNTDKLDLIKILKVKVKYLLNNKEETYEVRRLIKK